MFISLAFYLQLFVFTGNAHPLHVSVTEIVFDQPEKELEIVMRVFIDDLELTLRNDLKQPELDVLSPKNGLTTDQLVENYLKKHLAITVDGKPVQTSYLGHEREGEALVLYIGGNNVKKLRTIEVKNDIFTETYDDQSNLVHVTVGNDVKSLRLSRDNPKERLTFE